MFDKDTRLMDSLIAILIIVIVGAGISFYFVTFGLQNVFLSEEDAGALQGVSAHLEIKEVDINVVDGNIKIRAARTSGEDRIVGFQVEIEYMDGTTETVKKSANLRRRGQFRNIYINYDETKTVYKVTIIPRYKQGQGSRLGSISSEYVINEKNVVEAPGSDSVPEPEPTSTTGEDITLGLVGHYGFEDNVVDSSGNGKDGRIVGNVNFVAGRIGKAAEIGIGDYVDIGNNFLTRSSGEATLAGWIKASSISGNAFVVGRGKKYRTDYGLGIHPGGVFYTCDGGSYCSSGCDKTRKASTGISVGEWQHVAMVMHKGNVVDFYLNGVYVGSKTEKYGENGGNSANFYIGNGAGLNDCGATIVDFEGAVDEFRVYNRALSGIEISALHELIEPLPVGDLATFTNLPTEYTLNSGLDLSLDVSSTQAENVVFQTWSVPLGALTGFYTDNSVPFAYSSSFLNEVSAGDAVVQALVRDSSNNLLEQVNENLLFVEPQTCKLTNAYWNIFDVQEEDSVNLIVEGTAECDGESIMIEVREYDSDTSSNPVLENPTDIVFSGGRADGIWTAEWQVDSNGDLNPEYYFVASLVSDSEQAIRSPFAELLKVTRLAQPVCGDGVIETGEQCDSNINLCTVSGQNGEQICNANCDGWEVCQPTESLAEFTNIPAEYTLGSGLDLNLDVSSTQADNVVFQIWSITQKSLVGVYTDRTSEFVYPSNSLDEVPAGDAVVQALVRDSSNNILGQVDVTITFVQGTENPECGNNLLEIGEQCDDGNKVGGDGCSSSCTTEGTPPEPQPSVGWTSLIPGVETKIIYVSSSSGNDVTCRPYSPSEVGGDPFNPTTSIVPCKTINKGKGLLRNWKPDWMLLKRGEVFSGSLGDWRKNGLDKNNRMVVSAYGDLSLPRPIIDSGDTNGIYSVTSSRGWNNLAFVSLHFRGNHKKYGFLWRSWGSNMLIEDNVFDSYGDKAINIEVGQEGEIVNWAIRRNIIIDTSGSGSNTGDPRPSGMFLRGREVNTNEGTFRSLLIEENVFDHNGWMEGLSGGDIRTNKNHNVYGSRSQEGSLVFKGNILSRGSLHGITSRDAHTENNLFIGNAICGDIKTYGGGTVKDNVCIHGFTGGVYDTYTKTWQNLGWGFDEIRLVAQTTGNILAHTPDGSNPLMSGIDIGTWRARGNIVYNWGGDTQSGAFPDPERTIATYWQSLNGGSLLSVEEAGKRFANEARKQRKGHWREEYTADAFNDYIRAGFGM